jgi:hypothetical protein
MLRLIARLVVLALILTSAGPVLAQAKAPASKPAATKMEPVVSFAIKTPSAPQAIDLSVPAEHNRGW